MIQNQEGSHLSRRLMKAGKMILSSDLSLVGFHAAGMTARPTVDAEIKLQTLWSLSFKKFEDMLITGEN